MLPSRHRLTSSADFRDVVRRGRRSGRRRLVVHVVVPADRTESPPTVGFTVSKAVGGSVVRNRVKRRLRHLCAARVDRLPAGARVVVRALPPAASADSTELAADLDAALTSLLAKVGAST